MAFDPEHRLVVSLVCGRRLEDMTFQLVADFHARTGGRVMDVIITDEYSSYETAIREVYGEEVVPARTGKPGRPAKPRCEVPEGLTYARVHKEREGGRVTSVEGRAVHGTMTAVLAAITAVGIGEEVNTSHVERFHGTDRHRNARKVRKTYGFSKDWDLHEAVSQFVRFSYNFCWPVRTLRLEVADGRYEPRTPAMAAGLADHVWSLREWLTLPAHKKTKKGSHMRDKSDDLSNK